MSPSFILKLISGVLRNGAPIVFSNGGRGSRA